MSSLVVPPLQKLQYGPLDFRRWTQGTASLVSGVGLAAMAALMIAGYFGGIVPLVTAGDAAGTAADISGSPALFLGGVACIFVVTLLDIVVAAAWYALFKPVNRRLSAVAAWIRVIFAGLFMLAAGHLVSAFSLLGQPDLALQAIRQFNSMWLISLGLFGIYLLLIGYLAVRSGFMARVFGILLAIAGLGYVADAVGTAFSLDFPVVFGSSGFVGEVAVIFWLLIKGRRLAA
ncbi:DUF4386 domain-containing protein [Arthrobacter sp. Y81]|uniref:DUF4386 domain-containing protein n=1 Tax=Arthrobacter sp. Y81 TaxID=2058897 RepID=UPI000CE3D73E|nr:DUF4386 domain-containing protein [Arthrobacter sp. Y81]